MELHHAGSPFPGQRLVKAGVIRFSLHPDALHAGRLAGQRLEQVASSCGLNEAGCVSDADHADRIHAHGSDGQGLIRLREPADLEGRL